MDQTPEDNPHAQTGPSDGERPVPPARGADETPRKGHRVVLFAQNSSTDYSGGRYHSWMMAEALASAGHQVSYVTNNAPVFLGDFEKFPNHRDVQICLLPELGSKRLGREAMQGLRLEPEPWDRLQAESRRDFFDEDALGEELAVFPSAATRGDAETGEAGPFCGMYEARLAAEEGGNAATAGSRWRLAIVSDGARRSGVNHPSARLALKGGRRYLIECDVLCARAKAAFRLGIKSDAAGNLWAVNLRDKTIHFANKAAQWTRLSGVLTLPPGEHPSQLWLTYWNQEALAWSLDDVSLREILDEKLLAAAARDEKPPAAGASAEAAGAGQETGQPGPPGAEQARRREAREQCLLICEPFLPDKASDASPFSFYFVDPERVDEPSLRAIAAQYRHVLVEEPVAARIEAEGFALPEGARRAPALTGGAAAASARVLFLASNDTHVHYMLGVARHFRHCLFVIPKPSCKEEGAGARLRERGIDYVEIDYKDRENARIEAFRPDVALSGADWTSEFIATHAIVSRLGIPCVALQEGPQDWDQKIKGVDPRKYRNAEILFSQGAVTLQYIQPKYFAVTGNPKTDHVTPEPMPARPRLFVNCNFTYGQYEDCRQQWMSDVLETCRELGLDYIISKHPRDGSTWDDPNLVNSSAFSVPDQMRACSIAISRFSNISYEALAHGRTSIYYNPHGEPMKTFAGDASGGVLNVSDRATLARVLAGHLRDPRFAEAAALEYMRRHCGPMDGGSIGRVARAVAAVAGRRLADRGQLARLGREIAGDAGGPLFTVLICTHNRPGMLDQAIRSVIATAPPGVPYEILVVDNASTGQTRQAVERYLDRHPVRYLREDRLGLSIARNAGWRNSLGKYVVFLDDDGEACAGWLQGFLDVFEARPEAVAVGGRIEPRYEGGKPSWVQGVSERFYGAYDLGGEAIPTDWVPGGNTAWRRDVIEALGGFDERFGRVGASPVMGSEESLLIKRAREAGGAIYYSPSALMLHHVSAAKLKLAWLARRHYGQGKTAMRWGLLFGARRWTRGGAARAALRQARPMARLAARLVKNAALLRRGRAVNAFFDLANTWGKALEAARYAMSRIERDGAGAGPGAAAPPDEPVDVVILVPNNDRDPGFYDDALDFARARQARLVLLNFETPNWFNSLSPAKRNPSLWDNWKRLTPELAMVLSISAEGDRWARAFFQPAPAALAFDYCYPAINAFAADALAEVPRENRVLLLTRFVRGEHKGCREVASLVGEAMRGHALVLLVGAGAVPQEAQRELKAACERHGVRLEFRYRLSDQMKFKEIRRARLMLFPSLFEGFGLPPVEALYCGTPCVAFDLPVLRETCGDNLTYARHGDWDDFRRAIDRCLATGQDQGLAPGQEPAAGLRAAVVGVASFDGAVRRADAVVQKVMARAAENPPSAGR